MSLVINHNISALNTHRNITGSGQSMAKSIEKLSSGYKINVGADDPSGLIISEQLRSQISGLERAVRNSSEAFNLIGIAEGALNEMNTILKKMRALAIHAANSGVTSPEQVAADQAEMDSGIETLNRIANTTRYSDQYLLNGQKQLVYDTTTVVNEPNDHALLDTKMSRIDQVFKRSGVKMSIGFAGERSQYQANTDTSAQRAYLEADNANALCEIEGGNVTAKQEFILTGTSGSRLFSFAAGEALGTIVQNINNVRDSTGIGASLTFASDVRIDKTTGGTVDGKMPNYTSTPPTPAPAMTGYDDGSYIYQTGDVQVYNAGLNNPDTAKISSVKLTPDAASAFKVGYNCDGDGKIYAKVVDKSTNAIEYFKDKECTMLIGQGDGDVFSATNNSGIPSSPVQNLDGIFIELNSDNARDLDVYEIAVIGQRMDNQKDMDVQGIQGWADTDSSVMSGVNLGVNTDPEGALYYDYRPVQFEPDGKTVKTFQVNVYKHPSMEPEFLVASSGIVENNIRLPQKDAMGNITYPGGQTVRVESVVMDDGTESGLNITLNLPKKGVLDTLSGMTDDEAKAMPAYQDMLKEMAEYRASYSEIEKEYTSAQKARKNAMDELQLAQEAMDRARKEEEKLRRDIDRLEPRDITEQQRDAARDLDLAEIDVYHVARNAAMSETNEEAYSEVTKAFPGAPEVIAEQMAEQVLDYIENAVRNGIDPVSGINWDAVEGKLAANVRTQAPIANIPPGTMTPALSGHIDTILQAAYDAATNEDLIKNVGDAIDTVDMLATLETDYKLAQNKLAAAKGPFDDEIEASVAAVGGTGSVWAGLDADTPDVADALQTAILAHVDKLAADPNTDFSRYNWDKDKNAIIEELFELGADGVAYTLPGAGTEEQYRAIAADLYDSIIAAPNALKVANPPAAGQIQFSATTAIEAYADARQHLLANPDPDTAAVYGPAASYLAKIDTAIADDIQGAIDRMSLNPGNLTSITKLDSWLNPPAPAAPLGSWDDIATELKDVIDTFAAKLTTPPTPPTYSMADFTNPALGSGTGMIDAVKAALEALPATTKLGAATAALGTGFFDDALEMVWTGITGPSSSLGDYRAQQNEFANATIAMTSAGTTAGNQFEPAATGGAGNPAFDAAAEVSASIQALVAEADDGLTPPGTMTQAVADSIAEQLKLLAESGVDVSDPAVVGPGTINRDSIILNAYDAIPAALKAVGTGVTPAVLEQFVADVYDSYVSEADAAVPSDGVGNTTDGAFGDYTTLLNDYGALHQLYPGGGAIQRAEDRFEIYGDRIQDAPLKAETAATTRREWQRLVDGGFSGGAQAELTKLAEWFGGEVLAAANAAIASGNEDNWDDTGTSVPVKALYDALQTKMTGSTLWAGIQNDIATGTPMQQDLARAAQADFEKVVEKMFSSVMKPDYDGVPETTQAGDYVFRSPVKKYFDQNERVEQLNAELEAKKTEKEELYDELINELKDLVGMPDTDADNITDLYGDLVDELHAASEEFGIIEQTAGPLLDSMEALDALMKAHVEEFGGGGGKKEMPTGTPGGSVNFTNLGMRLYAVDYGSAETIRIQNKSGNLFYQYRESDSMEKLMIKPDTTVQVAGQDAQISLNGAPVFTTGLVANTTTPDFSGSLVFNAGTLGETSLAVAGYDTGKLFSKATALQGVEENEAEIGTLRRHFEPPAVVTPMGVKTPKEAGLLNKNGSPISLYMDFSQIDPSVEVKIDNYTPDRQIKLSFAEPDKLTIDASSLATEDGSIVPITVTVDPDNLANGYYITDPALKGVFIRTDDLVDLNRSGGTYEPEEMPTITASAGEVMLEVNTYATNPRKNTAESMDNFLGGMQFQLGNTQGDQDRTVYSIQSMAMSELGRISYNGQEYCLQNVLGGGLASLTKDPLLAMRVLEQAVNDVSTLRARLGAFQSNMLQSNINSLGVAVENITKTESAIRDTDMAAESTQFTRFQIMQQAGTSMLAQANQVSQNVLSLLQ